MAGRSDAILVDQAARLSRCRGHRLLADHRLHLQGQGGDFPAPRFDGVWEVMGRCSRAEEGGKATDDQCLGIRQESRRDTPTSGNDWVNTT